MTLRELLKAPGQEHQLADLLLTSVVIFRGQADAEVRQIRAVLPATLRYLARNPAAVLSDLPGVLRDATASVLGHSPSPATARLLARWADLLQALLDSAAVDELVERMTARGGGWR